MRLAGTLFSGAMLLSLSTPAFSGFQWASFTLDNDLFVGNDSGYTNGLYISVFDSDESHQAPTPSWMAKPLLFTLQKNQIADLNTYTVGQTMITPEDITIEFPSEDDLPYAGLLFFNNTYLSINRQYTDKISTTLGVVGPMALGEQAQKFVHSFTGSDEPRGWDSQLKNEFVFQFTRGRAWRVWESTQQNFDLITTGEIDVGTISSAVKAGALFRYGKNLVNSYATALLASSRITNPAAVNEGWYAYAGINAGYTFNQIFTDGNTFKDTKKIDYDHDSLGATFGFAHAWKNVSFSFALRDSSILADKTEKKQERLTRFGTLSLLFRL